MTVSGLEAAVDGEMCGIADAWQSGDRHCRRSAKIGWWSGRPRAPVQRTQRGRAVSTASISGVDIKDIGKAAAHRALRRRESALGDIDDVITVSVGLPYNRFVLLAVMSRDGSDAGTLGIDEVQPSLLRRLL